ncbi:hypothetical protein [Deinococcus multiflagellatus]|uniref:Uncharacterized protein n=1 Tax=Deinococcus multiflagellatus TaxID=1656887 RepID=A0ABW1ZNH0_9DEIO|nr:hypothetical protein [Deinococcus multiflagellatus]MBZ9715214.1 hypothetical protein [Deinococcus multiflagellatus]
MTTPSPTTALNRVTNFLGYFSLGLGGLEAAAPGALARTLGMEGREGLLRLYGAREIGVGTALLTQTGTGKWLWARVAGDVLDIATLLPALGATNPKRANAGVALASVVAVTGVDLWAALQWAKHEAKARKPLPAGT